MIIGHQLIKLKKHNDKVEIDSLEKQFKIIIPPILRVFLENFEWSNKFNDSADLIYFPEPRVGDLTKIGNSPIDIVKFTFNCQYDEVNEFGGLLIFGSRWGVVVGITDKNADNIYLKTSPNQEFKWIASDIFSFIRGLTDSPIEMADSIEEYNSYLKRIGYEGRELEEKSKHWKIFRERIKK